MKLFLIFKTSLYLVFSVSLISCSSIKIPEYTVKDSLYVWSDSFDDQVEANKVVTEYQTISTLQENLLNSDVQLIFEEMVINETAQSEQSADEIIFEELAVKTQATMPNDSIDNERKLGVSESLQVQRSQNEIESFEDINRINEENPTAAGIPINTILPDIKSEVVEIELPNQILLLAAPADYQSDTTEYGMWQMVKSDKSRYQEVCTLASSTIQVELENYSTQVWLNVIGNHLLVNSTTNIDIDKTRVGIKFDNELLQAFNKNYFQTSAVWSGDLEGALNQHKQLSISLGGNELGRRTQEISIGLKDLKKAYSEYRKCNLGTQIGSL